VPIFPGETTPNAAATAAAQGTLELWPVIAMGALGRSSATRRSSGSPAAPRGEWRRSSRRPVTITRSSRCSRSWTRVRLC
jgi:hypothetical protein